MDMNKFNDLSGSGLDTYNRRALQLKKKNIERFVKAANNKEIITEKEKERLAIKAKKENEFRMKAKKELDQQKDFKKDSFINKKAKIEHCL